MSSGATKQSSGRRTLSSLFFTLVDRGFDHFAGTEPTVLRTTLDDRELEWVDLPGSWPVKEVASASDLPAAAADVLTDSPALLFPPWRRRDDLKGSVIRDEHELVRLDCAPPKPGSLLAAVIPAMSLVGSSGSERFREELFRTWRPVLVQYSKGVLHEHPKALIATVFLRPRAESEAPPLRIFEYSAADDETAVLDDFDRLLARKGGRGDFGYVLRDALEPGESLSFARHDPRLKARRESLTAFGDAATIDEVFEILPPGLHSVADRALKCEADAPGAVRLLSGREIKRDGTIMFSDEQAEWATVSPDRQLRAGDIVTRAMRLPAQNLVVAEVAEEDLPAAANQSVAVLRPKPHLDGSQRTLVLQYLRSALARELLDAPRGGVANLNRQTLRELPLPRLDEALSVALSDLAEAARSFEAWRIEAETVLRSAFPDDEDFEVARAGIAYVMAISCKQELTTAAGKRRADTLARFVPRTAWQRRSCRDGAKGPRLYDWALVDAGEHRSLLIRALRS